MSPPCRIASHLVRVLHPCRRSTDKRTIPLVCPTLLAFSSKANRHAPLHTKRIPGLELSLVPKLRAPFIATLRRRRACLEPPT
jgi:hypothetical protein